VVVFFGYTQCPDVCPTTLATLAEAMKRLGSDADRVQVLFVTVDPERDTPELLKQYVPAFDRRFLGLWGDADATARTAKEFKVIYEKVPGASPASYTMDHSAGSYVFDPQGRLRLYVANGQGPDVFAHDLRELLKSAS
jgi:protein SCO1/2